MREGIGETAGIQQIGKKVGEDITGAVAGAILKMGDTSVRGIPLSKISVIANLLRRIPQKVLENYVQTGKMIGESASIKAIEATLGKSAKGVIQEVLNVMQNKETK